MHALADELRAAGFEVWIVSASFEPVVRVAAALAGFSPDHVIGTRLVMGEDGRYLGEHPYERALGPILTFDEGKRFWIRHVIFRASVETAMQAPTTAADRAVLAAGDSDTDRAMLADAGALAILFDRGAPLVTCLARAEPERFLVAPHFVDPQPPRTVTCP
jgi:phosphoserine phosphatase